MPTTTISYVPIGTIIVHRIIIMNAFANERELLTFSVYSHEFLYELNSIKFIQRIYL